MTEEDDPAKVAPQSLSITTRMTLQDWRAFESAVVRRWHAQSKIAQLVWLGLIVALGFVAAWLSDWLDSPLQLPGVFLGAGLVFIAVCLSTREARKRYLPDADGAFLGPELLCELLVHENVSRAVVLDVRRERAPFANRNTQGLEVSWCNQDLRRGKLGALGAV